jgi:hypothetical protein
MARCPLGAICRLPEHFHGNPVETIKAHIPSLSDYDESELIDRAHSFDSEGDDVANLALRTCACGVRIDGFYEYVDHLISLLK